MSTEPTILQDTASEAEKYEKLIKIKGIGEVNANMFVKNIPAFIAFLRECGLEHKLNKSDKSNKSVDKVPTSVDKVPTETAINNHPLYNKKIVMTKIRDKEIIDKLKEVGGILQDNVTSETFVVIVKSKDDIKKSLKNLKF